MKKAFIGLIILVITAFVAYKFWWGKGKIGPEDPKQQPLAIGENTGPFNQSFDRLLLAYYSVKDALVATDTTKANKAAKELQTASDSLKMDQIQGDSSGAIKETAKNFAGTITGSAMALWSEKDIEAKRKEFEVITDALWSLTRTVKYAGRKIYYQYCPMAFNNKGAYWMSNEREIKNPYFGNKMLDCGSVEDSLDYSKK